MILKFIIRSKILLKKITVLQTTVDFTRYILNLRKICNYKERFIFNTVNFDYYFISLNKVVDEIQSQKFGGGGLVPFYIILC